MKSGKNNTFCIKEKYKGAWIVFEAWILDFGWLQIVAISNGMFSSMVFISNVGDAFEQKRPLASRHDAYHALKPRKILQVSSVVD